MSSVQQVSKGEIDFTLQALRRENVRVDGRALTAYRRFGLRFGAAHGEVEVNFGPTRALAVTSGEVVTPPPERPNEGRISFHVEFGPIASPHFEVGRPNPQATSVANFVERLLKGSRAVDAEALCIVGGQKVWSIRVDVRALDDDGNLGDVCAMAALCSLLHFRKSDVEVRGDSAQVYSVEERVPVPLSIHHIPIPVTFALFPPAKDTEPVWILDPNRLEEAASSGCMCIAVTKHGELCGVHKPGGLPVDFALVEHCLRVATSRSVELTGRIRADLEADLAKRKEARRNVHQRYDQAQLLTVDWSAKDASEALKPPPPATAPPAKPPSKAWRARARARAERAAAAADSQAAVAANAVADTSTAAPTPAAEEPAAASAVVGTGTADPTLAAEAAEEPGAVEAVVHDPYDVDLDAELDAVEAEAAELEAVFAAVGTGQAAATGGAVAAVSASGAAPTAVAEAAEAAAPRPPRKKKRRSKGNMKSAEPGAA